MKLNIKSSFLALAGLGFLANAAMGAVTLENGSLAIAFYQVNTSNAVQANTYVFDLGQMSIYRENALNNVSVSAVNSSISNNISADLVSAFGSSWATSGLVRWAIVGAADFNNGGAVTGDPSRTFYLSQGTNSTTPATAFGTSTIGTSVRSQVAAGVGAFEHDVLNATSGLNADGTIVPSSNIRSIDKYVNTPNNTANTPYFKQGQDITQVLGANSYGTGVVGALDVFRVINSTSGADLTAGLSAGNATVGNGQYIGTFTLDSSGNVGIGNISAVPEPSGALALGLIGTFAGLGYRSRRQNANA
ncbi:MAG: hypothetical protein ABI600_14700 [Luteolibacter sp.]